MKTIYLVVWMPKAERNEGKQNWRVYEAYLTHEAARAAVDKFNAEDAYEVHKVVPTTLNEK